MRVPDTFAFLHGQWRLERVLVDHRTGTRGRFTGRALIVPVSGELASYTERGQLRFGAHVGPAARTLRYQARPDGTAAVRFADGRPFYILDLRSGRCQAQHPCNADRYQLTHLVHGADMIEEHWLVHGPDKDYHAITRLHRKPLPDMPIHRTPNVDVEAT
jgi:hypothetical protein